MRDEDFAEISVSSVENNPAGSTRALNLRAMLYCITPTLILRMRVFL